MKASRPREMVIKVANQAEISNLKLKLFQQDILNI
jgi:hypothetical protein